MLMFEAWVVHVVLATLLAIAVGFGITVFFTKHVKSISLVLILFLVPVVVSFAVGYLLLRS